MSCSKATTGQRPAFIGSTRYAALTSGTAARYLILSLAALAFSIYGFGQKYKRSIGIDLIRTAVRDPVIHYETVLKYRKLVQTAVVSVGYQFHYQQQFGFGSVRHWDGRNAAKRDTTDLNYYYPDDISLGVFQGPSVKLGYSIGKFGKRNLHLFILPAVGMKYQWYNNVRVNHDSSYTKDHYSLEYENHYRVQSGRSFTIAPQLTVGLKKLYPHIFYEIIAGASYTFKFRSRTVHYWQQGSVIREVPFTIKDNIALPGLVLSFFVGYVF